MTSDENTDSSPRARFLVMYDTPSDVEGFERHYNDLHIPLAKQYPGLRRFARSHEPAVVIGEPCYMVAMLDWDDMDALQAALGSEAGQRTAADAQSNLTRFCTFRAMILRLDDV